MGHAWLADITARATSANQLGLLGFGGDLGGYHVVPEQPGAFLLDDVVLGVEQRHKHDDLSSVRENDYRDVFLSWWPAKGVSLVAAYAELGNIANRPQQSGAYIRSRFAGERAHSTRTAPAYRCCDHHSTTRCSALALGTARRAMEWSKVTSRAC